MTLVENVEEEMRYLGFHCFVLTLINLIIIARSVCAHITALLSGASCQDSVNYRCCKSCQLLVQVFSTIILVPIVHRISRTLFLYRAT